MTSQLRGKGDVRISLAPKTTRPSELAVTIAALPGRYGERDGWVSADEVRGRLALLGFVCTAQQVAGTLRRMARVDCPWIETRPGRYDGWPTEYRVTQYARTDMSNRLPGVMLQAPWLPTYRTFRQHAEGDMPENQNQRGTDA